MTTKASHDRHCTAVWTCERYFAAKSSRETGAVNKGLHKLTTFNKASLARYGSEGSCFLLAQQKAISEAQLHYVRAILFLLSRSVGRDFGGAATFEIGLFVLLALDTEKKN